MNAGPRRNSLRAAAAAAVACGLLAMASASAHAELQGCPSDGAGADKLIIGSLSDLEASVSSRTQRALKAALEMRFEKAGAELSSVAEVLYCDGRHMQVPNSFDESVTGSLNDERVLLEVSTKAEGDVIVVNYIVIPLRYYEHHGVQPPRMDGYHEAIYEQSRISSGLAALFQDNAELRLMAALALALRHEKLAEALDAPEESKTAMLRARAFYCEAVGSLEAAKPAGALVGLAEDAWEELSAFAKEGALRTFSRTLDEFGSETALSAVAAIREEDEVSAVDACADALPGGDGTEG
jgi:hypothetical protein